MHAPQRKLARELLLSRNIDHALFAHPHSVTWLTGMVAPVQLGIHPFAGSPPLVWYADGTFTLIAVDAYTEAFLPFGNEPDCNLVTYTGYVMEQPIDGMARLSETLRLLWRQTGGGQIAVELADAGAAIVALLVECAPQAAIVSCERWLLPLRQIKHPEEITKLRENFKLTDVAQRVARDAVRAGAREIDVWTLAHSAVQQTAGCRVPFGNDCVVGYRNANIGGFPLDYPLRPGDSLIADFSTIRHGYWSDSCDTYYAGKPSNLQGELRHVVAEALEIGAGMLKPGAVAREIDSALRAAVARAGCGVYPHHSGHAVGVSGHESPRIVPYSEEVLAAGMVIMLEPGVYIPGQTGVRLEDGFLISEDGAERLTTHLSRTLES